MTSETQKIFALSGVRNVSENVILPIPINHILKELLTLLDTLVEHKDKKDLYTDMAERLSKIAGKDPAWGWRYVQSVAFGDSVEPGKKFARAVEALAVSFDGIPVPFARASPVTVMAETGSIQDGSFVMGKSVRCANPTCTVTFVPNVPWRKFCPVCSPPRGVK